MAPNSNPAPGRFVGDGAFKKVVLKAPVEYEGKVYTEITVGRMSVRQMREYVARASEDDDAIPDVLDCPHALIDELFPDDADAVGEAIQDFLPQRLKDAVARARDSGASTSESSPPNSTSDSPTSSTSPGTSSSPGI